MSSAHTARAGACDFEFDAVDAQPRELRSLACPACLEMPKAPTMLLPCQHVLCGGCVGRLDRWPCPTCREAVTSTAPLPRPALGALLEATGRCACGWRGRVGDYDGGAPVRGFAVIRGHPATCPAGHHAGRVTEGRPGGRCASCGGPLGGPHMRCGVCDVGVCEVCNRGMAAIGERLWWLPPCPAGHRVTPLPCAPFGGEETPCGECGGACGPGPCHYCTECGHVRCGECVSGRAPLVAGVPDEPPSRLLTSAVCPDGCLMVAVAHNVECSRCRLCGTACAAHLSCVHCGGSVCRTCSTDATLDFQMPDPPQQSERVVRCDAEHATVLITRPPTWYEVAACNSCGVDIEGSFHHCPSCGYDVCSKCSSAPRRVGPYRCNGW